MNSMMKNGRSFKIALPSFDEHKEKAVRYEGDAEMCKDEAPKQILTWASDALKQLNEEMSKWDEPVKDTCKEEEVFKIDFDHEIAIYGVKSYSQQESRLQVELHPDAAIYLDGHEIQWQGFSTSFEGEVLVTLLGKGIDTEIVLNFDKTYVNGYGQVQQAQAQMKDDDGDAIKTLDYYTPGNAGKSLSTDAIIQSMMQDYTDGYMATLLVPNEKEEAKKQAQMELPFQTEYVPSLSNTDVYLNGMKLIPELDYKVSEIQPASLQGYVPAVSSALNPSLVGDETVSVMQNVMAGLTSNQKIASTAWLNNAGSIHGGDLPEQAALSAKHIIQPGVTTYGYAGIIPTHNI